MPLHLLSVWGRTARPWGYEVRCDFVDEDGRVLNEVLTWPKEPDEKVLDVAVAALTDTVGARVEAESAAALKAPEPTREDLVAKVAALEAEKVVLTAERDTLIAAKPLVEVRR
jgi:hypothetical protein